MSEEPSILTAFVCANCSRSGRKLEQAGLLKPAIPDFEWPGRVRQVIVPCTGRLQPESILRAFEAGSSIVAVVACQEDNCHYMEGSKRCSRRIEYIRSILKDIGLEEGRLLLFHLPGSASEDLALISGKNGTAGGPGCLDARIAEIRQEAIRVFGMYPPSPLQGADSKEEKHE
jgi:F420-non-reducing hydrogenase iron-sulfur subunit